jgi:hypothetical protein
MANVNKATENTASSGGRERAKARILSAVDQGAGSRAYDALTGAAPAVPQIEDALNVMQDVPDACDPSVFAALGLKGKGSWGALVAGIRKAR